MFLQLKAASAAVCVATYKDTPQAPALKLPDACDDCRQVVYAVWLLDEYVRICVDLELGVRPDRPSGRCAKSAPGSSTAPLKRDISAVISRFSGARALRSLARTATQIAKDSIRFPANAQRSNFEGEDVCVCVCGCVCVCVCVWVGVCVCGCV